MKPGGGVKQKFGQYKLSPFVYLGHEFLTSGLLVENWPSRLNSLKLGGRWAKIRAKNNLGTKNPLRGLKIALKGGGAISAGAVFGHFSPKMAKKWPKSALSLYMAIGI